ncbi:FAD-dependent oxidoreductase [Halorubrum sp. JWXQ-INN 858]|uniref:NAD(P)/FAD-dependent oxidoreductase n=1 Tax=Halorubrum sp. JWXQ-INN 858 TaxID=2690782 RepID=UPI001356AED6|nr:FAD-binding oxidoreductase [Halorubrum sp. JWXQ-INN 858]MWV63334.1 FAD-dependent oxidoreductase [Halorubrum sp. JWXQ-INN 858]
MHVVVIGGGIVGLSSAHALVEAGVDVTLLERGSFGAGSTARSAGGIRAQFSTPINVRLSRESLPVWESFEERFGVDVGFRQHGYLLLARTAASADAFAEHVAMQNRLGVDSELLTPRAATERCPGLDPEPFRAATYHARDGYADPNLAVQGYARAAREGGADLRAGTAVRDVRVADGRVTGVETDDGPIAADAVVNAAGAWAAGIASLAGRSLPIAPRRRQVAIVEPSDGIPETVPLTIDIDTGSYFRPEREGTALVGGHFTDEDPDVDPDAYGESMAFDWAATALDRAADYASYFGEASRLKRGWAGLYAVTPDHHPILEETLPGFVTAAGFSGHGFQHAPATGQVVAELCVDGAASLDGVDALASDRFESGDGPVERNVA